MSRAGRWEPPGERPCAARERRRAGRAALAALVALAACRDAGGDDRARSGRWAARARSSPSCSPDFEREHPGIRVEVQQLPWTAAHEKLLTAFAGDATPDLCAARQHLDPGVRGARRAGAARRAGRGVAGRARGGLLRRASGTPTSIDGTLYGVPWYVDTRLLFYRRDLLAAAGVRALPATWAAWLDAMRAIKARGRAGPLRDPAAAQRVRAAARASRCSRTSRCCATTGGAATSAAPGSAARWRSTSQLFARAARAGRDPDPDRQSCGTSSARGYFALLHLRAVEHRRVQAPAAAPEQQATWVTAPLPGPGRSRRVDRRRLEPGGVPRARRTRARRGS